MDAISEELMRKLQADGKEGKCFEEYSSLKTDEERVKYLIRIIRDYNMQPVVECQEKNTIQSRKFRDAGNTYLAAKNRWGSLALNKSIEQYTKSVVFAPKTSKELSLAFASRSAALFKARLYDDCLLDINRALELDYPDELKAKLFARRARCLLVLDEKLDGKVENDLKEARKWLEKMDLKDGGRSIVMKTLDNPKKMACVEEKFEKWDEEKFCPKVEGKLNQEITGVSSAIELKYSEEFGKHIVATRDIKAGETLAVQSGYAYVLVPEKFFTNCSYCLKQTFSAIPCDYCVDVIYCNEECRDAAWKEHHDIECQVIGPLVGVRMSNLGLMSMRMAVMAWKEAGSFEKLKNIVENADAAKDPRTNGFTEGKLDPQKYVSVYTLTGNTDKRSTIDLFGRSHNAVYIIYMLATRSLLFGETLESDFKSLEENDWISFMGGLIMRHQQIIPCNTHSMTEEKISSEPDQRAAAILPFYSLFNHSCDPSVGRSFFGKNALIYAINPIKKGQQVFDNYGMHYCLQPRSSRQAKLLQQFSFKCECIACNENWPTFYGHSMYENDGLSNADLAQMDKVAAKFSKYFQLAMSGQVEEEHEEIIKGLSHMINFFLERVCPPSRQVTEMKETLKIVFDLLGNRHLSLN